MKHRCFYSPTMLFSTDTIPNLEQHRPVCGVVLANTSCVYGCRLLLYHFKVKISSGLRFMKSEVIIINSICE